MRFPTHPLHPRPDEKRVHSKVATNSGTGACERIIKTPIPKVYTSHTSRFTGTWLALLPFALYGIDTSWNHLATIPSAVTIALSFRPTNHH